MCLPVVLYKWAAPWMAWLLHSVAPEVDTISFGSALRSVAAWERARHTDFGAAPLMARVLPSVAPEVHTISFGSALSSVATWPRASSTASSAFQPKECERLAELPKFSVRYGIIFSATRRSTGVVAE